MRTDSLRKSVLAAFLLLAMAGEAGALGVTGQSQVVAGEGEPRPQAPEGEKVAAAQAGQQYPKVLAKARQQEQKAREKLKQQEQKDLALRRKEEQRARDKLRQEEQKARNLRQQEEQKKLAKLRQQEEQARALALERDKVLRDSRKPKDELGLEKNSGPVLPAGVLLTDGTWLPASILKMDETRILFRTGNGLDDSLPLAKVAVLLLSPIPETQRTALKRDTPGVLLRNGDYLESQPRSFQGGQVVTSSILYGTKTYTIGEAVALILRKPDPQ